MTRREATLDGKTARRSTHRKRRRKRGPTLLVTGWFCLAATLFLFTTSLFGGGDVSLRRRFAGFFALTSAALLGLRAVKSAKYRSTGSNTAETSRHGMTLAAVLAIGSALSALALFALSAAQQDLRRARALARERRLAALAADETLRRLQQIADDSDQNADHLDEDWAKPAIEERADGVRIESRVEDENRRLDLNALAHPPIDAAPVARAIAELLVRCGAPDPQQRLENLRAALHASDADRRDEAAPSPLPLRIWADLTEVRGYDRSFLDGEARPPDAPRPADVFTVAPFRPRHFTPVNINTAAPETLAALFGSGQAGVVRWLLSLREAAPLRSLEPLAAAMDPTAFSRLRPWLDIRSDLFRVETLVRQGDTERRVRALARREEGGRVRVLEWTEL